MAQQLLQHAQVGAAGMHVGGKGMTQHMWRDPSGLASPATAASLISSRAAWRVSALAPLRTGWNSQGEGAPPE
jgi:hypothetical protein